MCFNKKVIGGLIAIAIGLAVFDPGQALRLMPVLLMAACPLSMLAMSRSMFKRSRPTGPEQENAAIDAPGERLVALRANIEGLRAQEQCLAAQVADAQSRPQTPGVAPMQATRPLSASRSWEQ